MRYFHKPIVAACLLAWTAVMPAHAATVDVTYDLRPTYKSIDGVGTRTATYRSDLVGATVLARFGDGTTENWEFIQHTSNIFSVRVDHESPDLSFTYDNSNTFSMNARKLVTELTVNVGRANVIFDAGEYPDSDVRNSPTTKIGIEFNVSAGGDALTGVIGAHYSGHVRIGNHMTGEDSFTQLDLDFTGLDGGGQLGGISWRADLDVLATPSDLALLSQVPLPAGMGLLLTGIGALGFAARRRRRKYV